PLALGGGSNLLALDGDLPLALISTRALNALKVIAAEKTPEGSQVQLEVGAGLRLPRLLNFCAEQGFSGLEGLSGIPGTVGGAIAQNAGSFGVETCAKVCKVFLWQGEERTLEKGDYRFGYRHFSFAGHEEGFYLILGCVFELLQTSPEKVKEKVREVLELKRARQPINLRSAGCVFKNPAQGPSAGQLLEEAGLKGYRLGGVGFADLHANFLIHYDHGTATEALSLLSLARKLVKARSGIELMPEVRIVPWTPF
ncbi:MAG: UDP-N-acetylmuramate dehydrogenase, partial [Desulfovibrio sp.]|nr:UDP-N-acetylmuramate dehydrogenase [Desulfovibrio sp.]